VTRKGWEELVVQFAHAIVAGDAERLQLLTDVLAEQDAAKQALREKGYGCTGMGILATVGEVPEVA
jgi:hypothetical protein